MVVQEGGSTTTKVNVDFKGHMDSKTPVDDVFKQVQFRKVYIALGIVVAVTVVLAIVLGVFLGKNHTTRRNLSENAIPYARFVQHWNKSEYPYEATVTGDSSKPTSSNCLTLDINVPDVNSDTRLPVLVVFSGAACATWSTQQSSLLDAILNNDHHDVIVVKVNYRQGIWGFLYTGSDWDANFGLWDQHFAIRWIYEHIQNYNGDKNAITLLGSGIGGSSVKHQILHSANKGKIKRVVDINGGASSWSGLISSCRRKQLYIQRGRRVAAAAGCHIYKYPEMLECLRHKDPDEIKQLASKAELIDYMEPNEAWAPATDGDIVEDIPHVSFATGKAKEVDMLNIASRDVSSCDTSNRPDYIETNAAHWRWWGEHRFGDSIPVLEEVFPLYNTSMNEEPCTDSARKMMSHAGHIAAQELEAYYHAKYDGSEHSYFVSIEEDETSTGYLTDHANMVYSFVKTGDPQTDDKTWTDSIKFTSEDRKVLVTDKEHNWRAEARYYAHLADSWENHAYTTDGIDSNTKCRNPACLRNSSPLAVTKSGRIQGLRKYIPEIDYTYEAYLAVPYAMVTKRFWNATYPYPEWDDVFNATDYGTQCYQTPDDLLTLPLPVSEQCLHLYIYIPEGVSCSRRKKLPVMFHIHGGSFRQRSGANLPAAAILAEAQDTIIVSINYRLHRFGGFTVLNNSVVPSNLHYWDQHLALRWVNENIESFGGDRNLVTIMGFSAGGSSAGLQAVSPVNKGLFRRTLPTNLGITGRYGLRSQCDYRDSRLANNIKAAKKLNCDSEDMETMVDCLRNLSSEAIHTSRLGYTRIIDGKFFVGTPFEMIASGNMEGIDYMGGTSLREWEIGCGGRNGIDCLVNYHYTRDSSPELIPKVFDLWGVPEEERELFDVHSILGNRMFQFMGGEASGNHFMDVDYHHQYTNNKGYVYVVEAVTPINSHYPNTSYGPAHAESIILQYGFAIEHAELLGMRESDVIVSKEIIRHQMNFIKTGDPNRPLPTQNQFPLWDPVEQKVMVYTNPVENSRAQKYLKDGELEIWRKYSAQYVQVPTDPERLCQDGYPWS